MSDNDSDAQVIHVPMVEVDSAKEFYAYVAKHPGTGGEAIICAGPLEMVADVGPKVGLLRIAEIEVKLVKYTRTEDLDEVGEAIAMRDSRKLLAARKAKEKEAVEPASGDAKPILGFEIPQGSA